MSGRTSLNRLLAYCKWEISGNISDEVFMLPLDSPRWSELRHAYGQASNIPDLLRQVDEHLSDDWFELESAPGRVLWDSLCHQDTTYTATFAAVPHIIQAMKKSPANVHWTIYCMLASIEISRANGLGPEIPEDLEADYHASLRDIPALVAARADDWDQCFCGSALAAIAASKGCAALAKATLELDDETIRGLVDEGD
jgi:hypothetical protein